MGGWVEGWVGVRVGGCALHLGWPPAQRHGSELLTPQHLGLFGDHAGARPGVLLSKVVGVGEQGPDVHVSTQVVEACVVVPLRLMWCVQE